MSSFLILASLALAGQPAPEPEPAKPKPVEPVQAAVHNDWQGRYSGPGCLDGKVALTTDHTGSAVTGTYSFVADLDGDPNEGVKALYQVEGTRSAGVWKLEQKSLLNADELKGSADWCFGALELQEAQVDGVRALTGSWTAEECGCAGTVQLKRVAE